MQQTSGASGFSSGPDIYVETDVMQCRADSPVSGTFSRDGGAGVMAQCELGWNHVCLPTCGNMNVYICASRESKGGNIHTRSVMQTASFRGITRDNGFRVRAQCELCWNHARFFLRAEI